MANRKMTGVTDTPVKNASEDMFNVSTYVNGLCSFILSCATPMTISIQGDWGSGKTSMMNMIRDKTQDMVVPIWFNTWQFSQFDMGNALAFSMMDVLLKGLDCEKDTRKKIISGLLGFGKRAVRIAADQAGGGEFAEMVGKMMDGPNNEDYASEIVELKDKFQKAVDDNLAKHPGKNRVVVFVDDLDRLQPAKAVELLEVLKLFLDCKNCVFILAVDYEVVTLGIRQKYGSDVNAEKGKNFFDKIIQLPFKMPVAQYDIHNYVKEMLHRQGVNADDKECELFSKLISTSIGFNPRSMKRLFNTYQLLRLITSSIVLNVKPKVRERALFAIICAQMCYEKFYQYLASSREIEPEVLMAMADPDRADQEIREILQIDEEGEAVPDKKIHELARFMPNFVEALQIDDNAELSQEEIENMTKILKCSLVTSLGTEAEDTSTDLEYEYRNANKEYAKEVMNNLKGAQGIDLSGLKLWLPRKAHDDKGIRFSDVSIFYNFDAPAVGCPLTFECYFHRKNDQLIDVRYYISCYQKDFVNRFHELFGNNPLKLHGVPQWLDWGRYCYMSAHEINDNDHAMLSQIADQFAVLIRMLEKMTSSAPQG
jgi:hypothetical protein